MSYDDSHAFWFNFLRKISIYIWFRKKIGLTIKKMWFLKIMWQSREKDDWYINKQYMIERVIKKIKVNNMCQIKKELNKKLPRQECGYQLWQ